MQFNNHPFTSDAGKLFRRFSGLAAIFLLPLPFTCPHCQSDSQASRKRNSISLHCEQNFFSNKFITKEILFAITRYLIPYCISRVARWELNSSKAKHKPKSDKKTLRPSYSVIRKCNIWTNSIRFLHFRLYLDRYAICMMEFFSIN